EGRHVRFVGEAVRPDDGPPVDGFRPSATALFGSLASEGLAPHALCLQLTGMGHDGAAGLLEARRAGAWTIAQAEEDCVVFGMPKRAVDLGAACEVMDLPAIVERLK